MTSLSLEEQRLENSLQLVRFNGSGVVVGTELALQDAERAAQLAKELQAADVQLKEALSFRDKALQEQSLVVSQRLSLLAWLLACLVPS